MAKILTGKKDEFFGQKIAPDYLENKKTKIFFIVGY